MSQLWTETYFPKSLDEFIGNSEIVKQVTDWAEEWKQGKKPKPMLFYGQSGSGKTCLSYLISSIYGWNVFELNASDLRSEENINRYVGGAALNSSFDNNLRLVLMDEVDGLQRQDRGGIAALNSIIKDSQHPIILTANDIYSDQKLAPLRTSCTLSEFKKINYLSIAKRLKEILSQEGIEFEEDAIKELAKNSSGDFRSCLLDLQTLSFNPPITLESLSVLGYRERQEKVFKTMEGIFKGKNIEEIRKVRFTSQVSYDFLNRWIEENIPRIFTEGNDTANAFDWFSKADIFQGRIMRRQHWGFLRYSTELATSGMSLSREHDYHGWLKFQFPTLLSKLSRSSSLRKLKTELGKKVGKKTHSSARAIMSKDLPYLKMILKDKQKAINFAAQFELNEKELAFLLDTTPETKKVQTILEEAKKLRNEQLKPKFFPFGQFRQEEKLSSFSESEPDEKNEGEKPKDDSQGQTSLTGFL